MNDKFLRIIKKLGAKDKASLPRKPSKNKLAKNLPKMFFFTDRKRFDDIFKVVKNLPKNSAVIIREYDLNNAQRLDFALKISDIAKKKSLKVWVGKDWKLANKIKADGIHLSDREGFSWFRNFNKNLLVSYACHSEKSVRKAQEFGSDLIFYSPIFSTKSHPKQKPIGSLKLRNLTSKISTPIYALGGVDEGSIKILANSNIAGIGGISIFISSKPTNNLQLN
jgi:thiamine-phosphate pyrophosphorylase